MANELAKRTEGVSDELVEIITPSGQVITLEGRSGAFALAEFELGIPVDMVYAIKKGEKGEGGFTASMYDLIAQKKSMRFETPKIIYQDKNKIIVSVDVEYWNDKGSLVEDSEAYEVDCLSLYEKARFGAVERKWNPAIKKMEVVDPKQILVIRDEKNPENPPKVQVCLSDKVESDLYENFLTLQRNKLPKAITCAHRRLIQRAIGIKKFSANTTKDGWDKEIKMKMRGFLPAEADHKAGIKALSDLTGETLPPENKKKKKPVETETAEKKETPAPAAEGAAAEGEHKEPEKEKEETKKTGEETGKLVCTAEGCGVEVAQIVADYSTKFYHKVLCRKHQPKRG